MGAKLLLLRNIEAKQRNKAKILIHMQRILLNPRSLKAYSFFPLSISLFNLMHLCMRKGVAKTEIYYHLVKRSMSSINLSFSHVQLLT